MLKYKHRYSILLILLIFCAVPISTALAHPADGYVHVIHAEVAAQGLTIDWELKPGPMLIAYIWFQVDRDRDEMLSDPEQQAWAQNNLISLSASLDGAGLPLQLEASDFPSSLEAFQSGRETITLHLSAPWTVNPDQPFELLLKNDMEPGLSTSWYHLTVKDDLQFVTPLQNGPQISVIVVPPAKQASIETPLWIEWDSSLPALRTAPQNTTSQPERTSTPEPADITSREVLLDLIRRDEASTSFYVLALGISLVLGALHALTPGHGKTLVAAYLVGSRGTSWHAIVLGTIVTLTHTGSVLLIGIVTLAVSQYFLPTVFIPALELLSGLLILGLGGYLLLQRYRVWRQKPTPPPRKIALTPRPTAALKKPQGQVQIQALNAGLHHHGDGRLHSHEVPKTITWRSLIALGVSGGLVPCPDAIAILLVAIAINRIILGLALIVAFSFGLALVLIIIGLLMVNSRRLFDRVGIFERAAPVLPLVSAVVVLALGMALSFSAYVRFTDELRSAGAGSALVQEAHILYLADGPDERKQLFLKTPDGVFLLSGASEHVAGYTLAQDGSQVLYATQNENFDNGFWLVNLATRERTQVLDCSQALCSRPVFAPNGTEVIYEYLKRAGKNTNVVATPWWLNLQTGEHKPLFQTLNLPGSNPRWSPDGAWLSYTATDGVRLYNLQTGESRLVSNPHTAGAEWSPDSTTLLLRDVTVLENQQTITQVLVYQIAADKTITLGPDTDHETLFATWSPDGGWIAMLRRDLTVEQGDQIWVMRADGSNVHPLTQTPNLVHGRLAWSRDGQYLLYDVQAADSAATAPRVQIIDVVSGRITDLALNGYQAQWVSP